ncbi:MAG: RibD family protein [Ktedonobacteraceae bacterium]
MNTLAPLESLFDVERGGDSRDLSLPPELATLYGRLQFPAYAHRPYVIGNFVTTLDGVVALNETDHVGGGEISGFNQHDQMVMGLLRAVADAVIVGAGTLRSVPHHRWTAQYIYPALADAYQGFRSSLGKSEPPLNVIITAHGEINLDLLVFQSGEVPVLIVTTSQGEERICEQRLPPSVQVLAVQSSGPLNARDMLEAVSSVRQSDVILVEGGPRLMGDFFTERCLDELFLTLAPQIAGRDGNAQRPGFVAGKRFAPVHPLWGTLIGIKRGGSHLFLRYAFETGEHPEMDAKEISP